MKSPMSRQKTHTGWDLQQRQGQVHYYVIDKEGYPPSFWMVQIAKISQRK